MDNISYNDRKKELERQRMEESSEQSRPASIKNTSLLFRASPIKNWPYALALFIAILKDLLDFIGIGSLPAIGTAITICAIMSIAFIILMAGGSLFSYWILLTGGTIEMFLFGLNLLPATTGMVIAIYLINLNKRK